MEGVEIGPDGIHVERLDKDTPEEAEVLSERLYGMLPHIKLPELLLEVAGWTNFDRKFLQCVYEATGEKGKKKNQPL